MLSQCWGGGGAWAYVGHLTSLAFIPHPQEFDLEFGPKGGDVCFFCAEEWDLVTSSHILVCMLDSHSPTRYILYLYLIVSFEMQDLYSLTWYTARIVSVRIKIETITFDFITLNARFIDYFPQNSQSIKGINKKSLAIDINDL